MVPELIRKLIQRESPWATPTKIRNMSERHSEVCIPAILPFCIVLKIFMMCGLTLKNVNNSIKYSRETESIAYLKSIRTIASSFCSSFDIFIHCSILTSVSLITLAVLYAF